MTAIARREWEAHQGVDRLAPGHRVILTHPDHAPPLPINHTIGIAQSRRWRQWLRRRARILTIEPLIGEVYKIDRAVVAHEIGTTTVLMDTTTHIEGWRRHVGDATICRAAHNNVAPALRRAHLEPAGIYTGEGNTSQLDSSGDDEISRDG